MSNNDEIEIEKQSVIGGLDRFVTNIALAIVSVFPTFAIGIVQPWRLAPLIVNDEPEGRNGALLSPGAFFVVGLTVVLVIAAVVSTEETLAWNGSLIGPDWAVSVASTAAEGNIWKTVSKITPVFLGCFLGGYRRQFQKMGWVLVDSPRKYKSSVLFRNDIGQLCYFNECSFRCNYCAFK